MTGHAPLDPAAAQAIADAALNGLLTEPPRTRQGGPDRGAG
jgi:hypothetical protein